MHLFDAVVHDIIIEVSACIENSLPVTANNNKLRFAICLHGNGAIFKILPFRSNKILSFLFPKVQN
jgi:hypothetical protein